MDERINNVVYPYNGMFDRKWNEALMDATTRINLEKTMLSGSRLSQKATYRIVPLI